MASTRMALAATLVTFLAVAAVASATASATPRPRLMVSTLDGAAGANTATASNADLPSHELAATLAASLIHPAIGVAPDDAAVVLHLALVQDDAARSQRLEETFWSVSNPGSPREGQYLSHKDVGALMSPSTELLDAVRQWVRDAGVDDANVELSPWRDHMFVRTDVATVRRLTSLEVNVHQHRSTDPALARRHVLLASSSELPHDHVHAARVSLVRLAGTVAADASTPAPARQPARGRGSLRHALEQAANAEASAQPPAYPFSFWPPSPIASAEAMPSGRLLIESIVTCYSWSEESYPFKYSPPALEGTALSPCYFGGEIESLTVTLTDSQGNEQTDIWEVTSYSNGRGCAAANFVVDVCDGFYCTNDNIEGELMTLGVCVFTMDSFTMVADEAYNVTVTQTLESSMNGGARQWLGYPDALPLRVASTAAKLPSTLQSFYNIPTEPVACASTNRQSVGVLQPSTSGFYSYSDLDQFYNEAGISTSESLLVTFVGKATGANLTRYLDLQQWTPTSVSNNQDEPGDETSLDVQWISGMAPGAHTDVYHGGYFLSSTGGAVDPLLAAIVAIQYSDTPPLVLSMSYGGPEPSGRKRTTFENAWLAFGTMGISVLASSGDGGAFRPSVSAEATCQYPGVNYPASSPYVTGVGATQMLDVGGTGVAQEVVASIQTGSIITSGGGFSSTFSVPSYQAEAVAAYRARYPNAPVGRGRGVPDVALFGHNFKVVVGGSTNLVDGTSCSAPSFGGIVTLWNDARLRADMPALGFLNPKLYKLWKNTTGAFNDIVFGSNKCAGGNGGAGVCCSTGYQASPGWDPMTGIGSPNFLTVANALMGDGMLWTNGNCTISQRACGAATCGSNPTALPTWAIAVVVVGGIACCIGVACACVACNKKRRLPPQPAMNAYNPNGLVPVQGAGGGYVAPSPAYVAQPVPGPQGGYTANQYGAPSNQYGAPSNQYGAPTGQYGGPSYGGAPPAYDSQQPPPAYGYAQQGQGNSYVQMP